MSPVGDWLRDEVAGGMRGQPWHGYSLTRMLGDVDAARAAARPALQAHTIWEIVLHATAWTREVTRRLGGAWSRDPVEGDWPAAAPATPEAWAAALSDLDAAHVELERAVMDFPEERWSELFGGQVRDTAAGTGITYAQMVNGLVQHDAYHAGQIGLLKKAVGAG